MSDRPERSIPLPARVVVSLRAGFVLAIANVLCVAILAWAYLHTKTETQVITVTGSAKKEILSDLIVWTCTVSANDKDAVKGYEALKRSSDRTVEFLKQKGVPPAQMKLSAIQTRKNFVRDDKGNATDQVSSYDLTQ